MNCWFIFICLDCLNETITVNTHRKRDNSFLVAPSSHVSVRDKLEYLAVYGRASIHGTRSESRESLSQSQAK